MGTDVRWAHCYMRNEIVLHTHCSPAIATKLLARCLVSNVCIEQILEQCDFLLDAEAE